MDKQSDSPGIGVKLIAWLLMLGGIAGVIGGLYQEWLTLTSVGIRPAALTGLFVFLYGWSTWVGIELWHGEPWGFRMAKILFAGQIPIFAVPGFAFDGFFTGLRIYFLIGEQAPNLRFGFNLTSYINVVISPQVDHWLFGVNFVGVVALIHLMRVTNPAPAKDKFGLI